MLKIPTLEPKKHKKTSVVFDEVLQRIICYNNLQDLSEIGKIFICFVFLQKPNLLRTRMANSGTAQQQ